MELLRAIHAAAGRLLDRAAAGILARVAADVSAATTAMAHLAGDDNGSDGGGGGGSGIGNGGGNGTGGSHGSVTAAPLKKSAARSRVRKVAAAATPSAFALGRAAFAISAMHPCELPPTRLRAISRDIRHISRKVAQGDVDLARCTDALTRGKRGAEQYFWKGCAAISEANGVARALAWYGGTTPTDEHGAAGPSAALSSDAGDPALAPWLGMLPPRATVLEWVRAARERVVALGDRLADADPDARARIVASVELGGGARGAEETRTDADPDPAHLAALTAWGESLAEVLSPTIPAQRSRFARRLVHKRVQGPLLTNPSLPVYIFGDCEEVTAAVAWIREARFV
jgi:hypothetical protein